MDSDLVDVVRLWVSYLANDALGDGDRYDPVEEEIQAYFSDASLPWGPGSSHYMTNWCGIFATHILVQCGLNVKWGLIYSPYVSGGRVAGIQSLEDGWVTPVYDDPGCANVQAGDIGVVASMSHHFIITDCTDDGCLTCVDGNGSNWGNQYKTVRPGTQIGTINRRFTRKASDLAFYYSIG